MAILTSPQVAPILEDIAASLRTLAHRQPASESPENQAIRLLFEIGPDGVKAIAKRVGVSQSTLYRWKNFRSALERVRAAQEFRPKDAGQ